MTASPLIEFIAREHPAFVHVPLGLVAVVPVAILLSFFLRHSKAWTGTAFFMALVAWLGSFVALFSGLMWGRQINLIAPSKYLPVVANERQVLQKMLQQHEYAAVVGVLIGAVCVALLWHAWRKADTTGADGGRSWSRGAGLPALVLCLVWLGAWGFSGKLGGIMVFGDEATNKAAAEAEAAKRNDLEADLPIRALDYASLEPAEAAPERSKAHGDRWRRTWVTASGIDAFKAGKPLPPGAYAVMATFTDVKGKPSTEPGPLYMKETKADGTTSFIFYWARVPESLRKEVGGQDSVYWRSPDPKLITCLGCHDKDKS